MSYRNKATVCAPLITVMWRLQH